MSKSYKIYVAIMQSIQASNLRPLIDELKTEFEDWDYFSESLLEIFQDRCIKPTEKYKRFYSPKYPDMAVTYSWSAHPLVEIIGAWYFNRT